jgi:hypothetical protein
MGLKTGFPTILQKEKMGYIVAPSRVHKTRKLSTLALIQA